MRIHGIGNNIYQKLASETSVKSTADTYQSAYRAKSKSDSVEISTEAYEAYADDENLTATSGKDTLGITRGSNENSFVIHFSDSAMVSRAISRGYITVNGIKVELTEDTKKQLTKIDRQAQTDRERGFQDYIMQHELAVAQQQGEVYENLAKSISEASQIAHKISKGEKVSPSEEQELMKMNPQLYVMSKNMALLSKQQDKKEIREVQIPEKQPENNETKEGVETSSMEWKSYETQLTVSMSDTPQIQSVSEGEIVLK